MEEDIKAEFERSGFSIDGDEDGDILRKCLTYCINFKLSPSDLVSNWEIYYLNRHLSSLKVENDQMDGFLAHLQNEVKERIIKEDPHFHVYSSNDIEMLFSDEVSDTKEGIHDTPGGQYDRPYGESTSTPRASEKPSSPKDLKDISHRMTPFGQRMSKFTPHIVFNAQNVDDGSRDQESTAMEDDVIRRVQPGEKCSLEIHSLHPEPGCMFMYDRTEDRFKYLENRIRKHANAFAASALHGEPTDATLASQKNIFSVGMVCCDGEGHLNEKSILFQGSVEHSGGQRVRLDLQKLANFSLFPGQVIGIEGHNPSGHCLIASKVVDCLPISTDADLPPAKKIALDQEHQPKSPNNSRVLSLVIAAGPFTTSDNLLFEPLTELLAYASRKQPQLLILMGPFIDSEHPEIKRGTVDRSFNDIFYDEILKRLQDHAEFIGSAARMILVPSTRDANHDFVFPQPAFKVQLPAEVKHQMTCIANPGLLSANEIITKKDAMALLFDQLALDILKQLSGEEISKTAEAQSEDRMGRLATHVLRQRSYYPLYPPSIGVPLDLSLAPEALEIPSIPDILILPSDLAPFVKVLSLEGEDGENTRCICVNPGRLAKGIGGGTFAELYFNTDPDKTNASIIRI